MNLPYPAQCVMLVHILADFHDMTILRAFNDFPTEAAVIGRMLAGYADLEISLMYCAKAVRGDLDITLKTMFRGRGNSQRIDIADALAMQPYLALGIGEEFKTAIRAVRYCLKVRNLYAHCTWWNDNSGELAFANLEELAKEDVAVADLHGLAVHHVTTAHLEQQLAYFEYADNQLIGVLQEGNRRAGRPTYADITFPMPIAQPPLFL